MKKENVHSIITGFMVTMALIGYIFAIVYLFYC
jgi:hypothetical protein